MFDIVIKISKYVIITILWLGNINEWNQSMPCLSQYYNFDDSEFYNNYKNW